MKNSPILILLFLFLLPLLICCDDKQVYVVYLGEHDANKTVNEIQEDHHSYLLSVKPTLEDAKSSLIYSYKSSINGFAALLTPDEASKLSEIEEVLSVIQSNPTKYSLQTTRSWEFAGLRGERNGFDLNKEDLLLKSRYGKNVIVGMIDTCVWPESKSFSDEGMGPFPSSWKGICETGDSFNSSNCNKKIIGARYYIKGYEALYGPVNKTLDYRSPRDNDGHGTHTASTVGGQRVHNVPSIGGFAGGTASGGAPLVHLAIYKVCWAIPGLGRAGITCLLEDILAAIDDAIADGVHVLSISISTSNPINFHQDGIAIGALHALKKNIVVACSAGNSGPAFAAVSNIAPWVITVGASSIDREFPAPVILGDGMRIAGQTITPYKLENKMYPLVYASQIVTNDVPKNLSGECLPDSLSPKAARGKIVLCLNFYGSRVAKGLEVKRAGGIGFILGNSNASGTELVVDAHILPATAVTYENALKIINYTKSTKRPTAYITLAMTKLDTRPAPVMAAFSSRGPNAIAPHILKPDIAAPGLNILAAWSEASSPTELDQDRRVVKYNILSGTSMLCPHVGGVLALLKAIHRKWSSAAIRSALMTSAEVINSVGMPITDAFDEQADPFQFGSGHFSPTKAADPGLIYDVSYVDYLLFLCGIGVKNLNSSFKCPQKTPSPIDLNYPSLAIPKLNGTVTAVRSVTNVGSSKSVYYVKVKPPSGFSVKVSPSVLFFTHVGQTKRFTVTVKANSRNTEMKKGKYVFGWYNWFDGIHSVQSPIAIAVT